MSPLSMYAMTRNRCSAGFSVMPQNEELSSRHVQAQSSLDGAFQIELSRLLINIGQ